MVSFSKLSPATAKQFDVWIIEGVIGAGKTTLLANLITALRSLGVGVVVAPEPVKKWQESGLFKLMYDEITEILRRRALMTVSTEPVEDTTQAATMVEMTQVLELLVEAGRWLASMRAEKRSFLTEREERMLLEDMQRSLIRILGPRLEGFSAEALRALQAHTDNGVPGMFQVYAFCTRIGELLTAEQEALAMRAADPSRPVVMLCERSIYSDREVFKHMGVQSGFITEVQSRYYEGCFEVWERVATRFAPDMCVFVNTSVQDGMQRIAERSRGDEQVSVDYETALWKRHQELFVQQQAFVGAPIIVVDGGRNFRECERTIDSITRELLAAGAFCEVSAQ
jgi:deoxyadenosine/deoxycytidine kinase/predicted ATPase